MSIEKKENKLYELEVKLETVRKKLDKAKGKRLLIIFIFYFVVSVFIVLNITEFDYSSILPVFIISAVASAILVFVPLFAFSVVTDLFTKITYLEDIEKDLMQKIHDLKTSDGEYYDEFYADEYKHNVNMKYYIAGIIPPNNKH